MKAYIIILFLALSLNSCTKDIPKTEDMKSVDINFVVDDIAISKADISHVDSLNTMSLFCYGTYEKYDESNKDHIPNWMYRAAVIRASFKSPWSILPKEPESDIISNSKWGDHLYYSFFAFAPNDIKGATYSDKNRSGPPSLTYKIPSAVHAQSDILYSRDNVINGLSGVIGHKPVPLKFNHALSKINFKAKLKDGYPADVKEVVIYKITLTGLYESATLNYNLDSTIPYKYETSWDFTGALKVDYIASTKSDNGGLTHTAFDSNEKYISKNNLYLFPQPINDDSKLIIECYVFDMASDPISKRKVYQLNTLTKVWTMGGGYCYTIEYDCTGDIIE